MPTIDQQFVEYIVKSLVGHPDDIIVERSIDERGVLLTLTVNPEDLGRIIGKRGVTAQSLRALLRALGIKNDARYNLKIINNDGDREAYGGSADEGYSESESATDQGPVEKTDSNLAKNTRKELAELDDLDI